MPAFTFNKLVRDKLPAIYKKLDQRIVWRHVSGSEYLEKLRDKLIEESTESPLEKNDRKKIIGELADIEQVLDDIKAELDISDKEVQTAKREKADQKGSFSDGIYVEMIELNETDEWIEYYRSEPDKYREVQ